MSIGFLKIAGQFPIDDNINPPPPPVVNPFFVLQNGVTIRLKGGYPAGTTGQADGDTSGKIYTAVDNTMLFALDPATDDYTSVCTTLCTDMNRLFYVKNFNQDISSWDTANVIDMSDMFFISTLFNQPLNNWDVSSVINMEQMFSASPLFNQPLNNWDVSNVTNMSFMFGNNTSYNQPLNNWDVSSVVNMKGMFSGNNYFNQSIKVWNVSNVNDMVRMFNDASNFNQDLSKWCVEQIPTEPTDFDTGATAWTEPKPNWGAPC